MKNVQIRVGIIKDRKNSVVAMATVKLGSIVLGNIRILENSKKELFIGFPSYKDNKGEYKDIFYIDNKEQREKFQKMVIDEYNHQLSQREQMVESPIDEIPF